MVSEIDEFKENVKNSFKRVKDHMDVLKQQSSTFKHTFISYGDRLDNIEKKIEEIHREILDLKEKLIFSSGNIGVAQASINNKQQSSNNIKHMVTTVKEQNKDFISNFDDHNYSLNQFDSLTDREFGVFLAIYELSSQMDKVSYDEVANLLKVSTSNIRGIVSRLITRGFPIVKERPLYKKALLSINEDFKGLNLSDTLVKMKIRRSKFNRFYSNYPG